MKRGMAGGILLLAVFLISLLGGRIMERRYEPMARTLGAAADLAAAGEWGEAKALTRRARAEWEKGWHFAGIFADHTPMEDVDALFARLEVYEKQGAVTAFAAGCGELSRRVEALADAHRLSWWNLL